MICFIALPILAILGIFSATHRRLFYEAMDCVFRKATLRKCQSQLDERLRANISGKLFNKSPKLGSFVFRRFQILSFIFMIIMILSLVFSVNGVYNYVKYGNCNGPNSTGICIFNIGKENCQTNECTGIDCNCTFGECNQSCTGCSK